MPTPVNGGGPPFVATTPAPATDAAVEPREPVLIFAPYLPLREPVIAGEWWIGSLKRFDGSWRDDHFKELAQTFIASFRDARGQPLGNPALVAHRDRGADGVWPGAEQLGNLQLALDFAVLDANQPWEADELSRQGWLRATSDNSRLVAWSIDTGDGRIALRDGVMVQTIVSGLHIGETLVMRAPTELHIPEGVLVAQDLLDALLAVFSGKRTANSPTLAKRLAIAVAWLAQAWRNTESIRQVERIVMLKTAFEALTKESNRSAGRRLDKLFGELRGQGVTDSIAEELLWRPSEKEQEELTRTWLEKGEEKTAACTPLNHWFQSFTDVRNAIIHEGSTTDLEYEGPAERYRGPFIFIGERLLRESIRVTLRQFGYTDLWKSYQTRLITRALEPLLEKMLQAMRAAEDEPLPPLPDGLEVRPFYMVGRRRSGGWLAWTAREGVEGWQPVRFPQWQADRPDVIDNGPMPLMELSSVILGDAVDDHRSFDELFRGDSGNYQALWHRFIDERLLTIEVGERERFSPADVLAWVSAQPEYEALLAGGDPG